MKAYACATLFILPALPATAENAIARFFPDEASCYGRSYSPDHLKSHPQQRVTAMAVSPDFAIDDPMIGLWFATSLRGVPGGNFEAYAYCENGGPDQLLCGMEGDAGSFSISPAKNGAILVEVGRYGIGLEADTGFVTLESQQGDDRSFILQPLSNCP